MSATPLPLRILIVDDQAAFRDVARRLLEWRGYHVAGEAECAATAMQAAAALAPDAVLLDVGLGATSGFEVASALNLACPDAGVLLVSAYDYRHCAALLRDCGARGFVLKSELAHADLADYWPAPAA